MTWFIYETYTLPLPLPLATQQTPWYEPWSEPVRVKINPVLAVALATSGLFAPVLEPNTQIIQKLESRWHYAWNEPVRLKIGLHPSRHPFTAYTNDTPIFRPIFLQYFPLSEPVRIKPGLRAWLQQFFAWPPRLMPPPNVFMTLAATETNTDTAQLGIWAYTSPPVPVDLTGVNVSVEEIAAGDNASASIKENES